MKSVLKSIGLVVVIFTGLTTGFAQNAQKISPDGVSWIDPEILNSHSKMAFQVGGSGSIWIGDINPLTGLFVNSGTDLFIDNGATSLTTSHNGPEFGISANGWSVFYTKTNAGVPQPWRAIIDGTTVTEAALSSGPVPRLSVITTKDTTAASVKMLYAKGTSFSSSQIYWADENNPANEVAVDTIDEGARWIDNTQSFAYTKYSGKDSGQVAIYNTLTSSETIITSDSDKKTYSYGWFAPEYDEVLILCIVNDSTLGIYKNNGKSFWDRILTIEAPPAAYPFRFFGSPEPFEVNGKSYISFVLKTISTTSSYVDAEVWVMDLEPDISDRFMLRCDDGTANTKRTDPESYIGANEVFIYYNLLDSSGEFEVWRYATGISTSVTGIKEMPMDERVSFYPNPATETVHLQTEDEIIKGIKIFNLNGKLVQNHFTNDFSVSNLSAGIYIIQAETDKSFITHKLIKQ